MSDAAITGSALYRQRMAIPPDARLHVRLEDVSRQDVPAELIAECTVPAGGRQVPLPFRLEYDVARIEASHRYSVRASLSGEGRLLFTTDTAHPVITGGAPTDVTIMLVPVTEGDTSAATAQQSDASLVNIYWKLLEVGGEPAVAGHNRQEPHMILQVQEQRLAGSSGCNRLIGTYEATGDQLRLSPTGMTMMMCPEELMQQERALTTALRETSTYRVTGQSLELFDGEQLVARFESRYL
jgi:putative lipoprotein